VVGTYGRRLEAASLAEGELAGSSALVLVFDDQELAYAALAVLNSVLGTFWARTHGYLNESGVIEINAGALAELPLPQSHRSELARIARRIERWMRSKRTELPLADERQVDDTQDPLDELYEQLNLTVFAAFGLVSPDFVLEEAALEEEPLIEHLMQPIYRRVSTGEDSRGLLVQGALARARAQTLIQLGPLTEELGLSREEVETQLMQHAVEINPARVLSREGLAVLRERERLRKDEREADQEGSKGPVDWPSLGPQHYESHAALPGMTEAQSHAHHWRHYSELFRASTPLYYLGDLSDMVEEPIFALLTHDPAEMVVIIRAAFEYARERSFHPPGPATLADPRSWGLWAAAEYELQSILRTPSAQVAEQISRREISSGVTTRALEEAYLEWLVQGRPQPDSVRVDPQLDLAKLVDLEHFFSQRPRGASLREAAIWFTSQGWNFAQTRSVLEALVASGRVESAAGERWKVRSE